MAAPVYRRLPVNTMFLSASRSTNARRPIRPTVRAAIESIAEPLNHRAIMQHQGHLQTFEQASVLPVSVPEAFAWHARPGALERLIPPWERVTLVRHEGGIADGAQVELVSRLGPLRLRWLAEHFGFDPPRMFRDRQLAGPFAFWEHTHAFEPAGPPGTCLLRDHVQYRIPGGWLGRLVVGRMVRSRLRRMFTYRHTITLHDLAAHAKYGEQGPMKIAVSGASGLIGSELCPFLTTGGHQVTRLVRHRPSEGEIYWNVKDQEIDTASLAGHDAVVHLAGENVASGRWTDAQKKRIRNSRVDGTRLLCEALAGLEPKPHSLICASATGYYPVDTGEELTEASSPGDTFLAEVCREWEAAAAPAIAAGIRVVYARFSVVLSAKGGALAKMLTPFRLGLGGRLGSGRQVWSWVAIDDAIGAILHALTHEELRGPMNVVAPHAVTNREFTKTLGRVLGRPTVLPMPAFAARLVLGEMADDLLLTGMHVVPQKLLETGYEFRFPKLEGALRHLLGRE